MDGKAEKAIPPLEKAVSMQPEDGGMHFILGQAYRDAGRLKDARREFEKTKELGERASSAELSKDPGTRSSQNVGERQKN
jgi:Flp pilus assembly protein TadD